MSDEADTGKAFRKAASLHWAEHGGDLKSFDVPEYLDGDGNPVKMYYRQRANVAQVRQVFLDAENANAWANDMSMALIIFRVCALNAKGERLYGDTEAEIQKFDTEIDPWVILRLVGETGMAKGMFPSNDEEPGSDLDPTNGASSK